MAQQTKLTERQAQVLGVVVEDGPLTARTVGEYHLPIGADSARSHLAALERKLAVEATYTVHEAANARAFVATDEGREALDAHYS